MAEKKQYTNLNKRWKMLRVRGTGDCNYAYSTDGRVTALDEAALTLNSPVFIDAYSRRMAVKVVSTSAFEITSMELWAAIRGPNLG